MRKLTIERKKSFVGCLVKLKVYIEDPLSSELNICNTPCRRIGMLKNGEEKTFLIEDNAAKIFVIADTLSKDFCCDCYQLPQGSDDISLSGKNEFNPFGGNAFRFDNNETADIAAFRKKGVRGSAVIITSCIVIGLVIGLAVGFKTRSAHTEDVLKEKTFTCGNFSITLNEDFNETEHINFNAVYSSLDVAVFVSNESFDAYEELRDFSAEDYMNAIIQGNEITSATIIDTQNYPHYEYYATNNETNITYYYCAYVYKTETSFWVVQFATKADDEESYKDQISIWAQSVTFSNSAAE